MAADVIEVLRSATGEAGQGVPEPGQVVEVRGSTWAVAQVRQQGLPRSPADEAVAALNHAVTLQAMDEVNRPGFHAVFLVAASPDGEPAG